jgi:hypothetical protein
MAPRNAKPAIVRLPGLSKAVKDVLASRVEHKRVIGTAAYADLSTSGTIGAITQAIAQGDDLNARSGDTILLEKGVFRFVFKNEQGSLSNNVVRVIIFSDSMCNGTNPSVTDVLASASPISGLTTTTHQANRFKIYYDKMVCCYSGTQSGLQSHVVSLNFNRRVHYLGSSGSSASGRNSMFVLFITDIAVTSTIAYKWSYDLQYTDS